MMQQLNIEYFFPLTEQIPLDLDFTLTEKYILDKRSEQLQNSVISGMLLSVGNGGTTWTTISSNLGNPSFTINVDAMPITIVSKKKPNFIMKFIYKSMGMKWKAE
jgi:hypothetical protein